MNLLKIGISGVRGIVGQTLTPRLALDFASAFGTFMEGGPVCLGRDTRASGPMLHEACLAALLAAGCEVLDLGVCPTPILQYAIRSLGARGGLALTAGHNDREWNALTFLNRDGTYFNSFQGDEVLDLYHLGRFAKAGIDGLGSVRAVTDWLESYADGLAKYLDAEALRKARPRIVVDACNGAGARVTAELFGRLGVQVVAVNDDPSGYFPHDPEPRPRNAQQVASMMKALEAVAGFVFNSDVSRVSLVAEDGETLSEEFTFPLVAQYVLAEKPGPVVTNLTTSRMIDAVAERFRCPVTKTRVGQSHVIQGLVEEDAVMAGEGSGSVAVAEFQPAFDGFLVIGLILECLVRQGKPLSRLVADLPRFHIVKEKAYCPPDRVHSVVSQVKRLWAGEVLETADGLRVESDTGWVHVRASATEPMIRVIAEDVSKDKAQARAEDVLRFISGLVK